MGPTPAVQSTKSPILKRPETLNLGPETILIIKPGSFGDVIHALPCAAALKKLRPHTRITWLVDERWEPLLTDNPVIDKTIVFPREQFRGPAGALRALAWIRRLCPLRPDVALDLQGLLRSALMARFSQARHITGLADAREGARWFYDAVSPVLPGEHSVLRCLRSLETLGLPPAGPPEFPLPAGSLPDGTPTNTPFVVLHPFARGKGKSLPPAQVAAFCHALAPLSVVLAGQGRPPASLPPNTIDLLNRTRIGEMIGLLRAAAFVVSVDSGPMHIAAALHPRLLSIHTWSDPRLVGPYNEQAWIWQGGEIRRQNFGGKPLPPRSPTDTDITQLSAWVRSRIS